MAFLNETGLSHFKDKLDASYAAKSHTHNYAGSSSAGGAANSAVALTTNAGSSTQPVYFSGGKPVAIGYTIAKSVPSNAVFTDTNTTYSAGSGLALSGTTFRLNCPRVTESVNTLPGGTTASIKEYTNTSANLPSSHYYHVITMEGADTNYATQLALGMTTTAAYYRNYNGGTWSGWKSIIDTNTTYTLGSFGITATAAQLNFCSGVTSNIQTQLNGKASSSHNHDAGNITSGTLPIARGGTGATTAANARTNLGLGNIATKSYSTSTNTRDAAAYIGTDGVMEIGRYIDMHYDEAGSEDYDFRISIDTNGNPSLSKPLPIGSGGTGGTSAAAARANLSTLGAQNANGYWGMTIPDGSQNWIRTTSNGLIPYSNGQGSLGTSNWYFSNTYTKQLNTNGSNGIVMHTSISSTAASSATSYPNDLRIYGTDGTVMGNIGTSKQTSNRNAMQIECARTISNTTYYFNMRFMINNSGQLSFSTSSSAAIRNALGLGNTGGAVPVANGGTGATARGGSLSSGGLLYNIGIQAGTGAAPSSGNAGAIYIQYS